MTAKNQTYTILLVEDDLFSRQLLSRQLAASGYLVRDFSSAESAREELRTRMPSLLLADIQLEGMSGLDLLTWVRRESANRRLPVILISGLDRPADVVRGLELGASDYVNKPISLPILLARIRSQLMISDMVLRLENQAKILARMAAFDALTGAFNRLGLAYFLKAEVDRSIRYREPLSSLMLDLDHFKPVNDRYGHPVGDQVLRETAGKISATLRTPDLLCRYGGEEFLVILPHTEVTQAVEVGERIRRKMESEPFVIDGVTIPITLSVGAASLIPGGENPGEEMITAADRALYRAKREGRNRVCFSPPPEESS